MAIEIIKRGLRDSELTARFHCLHCKSELKAARGDGEFISDQRDGDSIRFACPVCQRDIWVAVGRFRREED